MWNRAHPWFSFRFYPFLIGLESLLGESRCIALLLSVYVGTRWGWVVSTTPRPPCPRERPGTHCIGDWVGPRAGVDRYGKFAHTGIRSPDLPAHSKSLHRLRYLGSQSSSLKTVTITILYYCNKSYIRHPGIHVTQNVFSAHIPVS